MAQAQREMAAAKVSTVGAEATEVASPEVAREELQPSRTRRAAAAARAEVPRPEMAAAEV